VRRVEDPFVKLLIIFGLLFTEAFLAFALFVWLHPHVTRIQDVGSFAFSKADEVPVSNSHSKSPTGHWFFFISKGQKYAFESKGVVADQRYIVSEKIVNLGDGNSKVLFCRKFNEVEYLIGRLFIMLLGLVSYLSFCGWIVRRYMPDAPTANGA
jgi:hypothetical protein